MSLRLLTYNLWHGVTPGERPFQCSWLEPDVARIRRREILKEVLAGAKADVLCLQEVNPLEASAEEFLRLLGGDGFTKRDASGVKFLGVGYPAQLNSGLLTIIKRDFGAQKVASVQLSGDCLSWAGAISSWQWSESRYALLVEWIDPQLGRILVANLHLHHGLEWSVGLQEDMRAWRIRYAVQPIDSQRVEERLRDGNKRRKRELARLMDFVEPRLNRYHLVLLAGDWNQVEGLFEGDEAGYLGFRDLAVSGDHRALEAATFDETRNQVNHARTKKFPLSVDLSDVDLSVLQRESLVELLRRHEAKPRRIDRIFARFTYPGLKLTVEKAELLGVPNAGELAPSDHFGLLVELGWKQI